MKDKEATEYFLGSCMSYRNSGFLLIIALIRAIDVIVKGINAAYNTSPAQKYYMILNY